jgi:hypothetical protein
LPTGLIEDFRIELVARAREEDLKVDNILAGMEPTKPLLSLAAEAGLPGRSNTYKIEDIFANENLFGRNLLIARRSLETAQKWLKFATDFQAHAGRLEAFDRPVLILLVEGCDKEVIPESTPFLDTHIYDGWVGVGDSLAYASFMSERPSGSAWLNDLKIAIIANLAQWDGKLCQELSRLSHKQLFHDSLEAIRQYSGSEKSNGSDELGSSQWASGYVQHVGDTAVLHSGWLLTNGRESEVRARIWQAHLSVIFPVLEDFRRKFIEYYKNLLPLPLPNGFGDEISDPFQLELSTLKWVVDRQELRIRGKHRHMLKLAHQMRNCLAHMTVINAKDILLFDPSIT